MNTATQPHPFRIDVPQAVLDDLQTRLKGTPKAADEERIYIHGEKEFEEAERRAREGIPLNAKVLADLKRIAEEYQVQFEA